MQSVGFVLETFEVENLKILHVNEKKFEIKIGLVVGCGL